MTAAKKKQKPKKPLPRTDAKQSSRFLAMAKKVEADESGGAFERALDVLAPKPKGRK